ncbi:MAG: HlyD family efflux transporter periplasmic adaptor subunit [Oscillospiraceae bacterium]|nr:HlyD family efflux transporter periplasmic adaptor subunit [Oscillospiraceae bacterium]
MDKAKQLKEFLMLRIRAMDRQQRKRAIATVCAVALVIALAVMPMLAANNIEDDGPKQSVLSGKVELGSITKELYVGGTLTEDDAVAIRLPDGVKIKEFLVENYSAVKEGDALASVDVVSVMTAISGVQETLDYLKAEIEAASDNTVTKTVTAAAGGKVKAVYAEKGDDVAAVMTEHGALAVLSLDDMMAVKIDTNASLSAGDRVWVGFEDGTEVIGRVESAIDGTAVITVEDDNYPIGAKVVITDSDDKKLGDGDLYVHHAWNAVAYSGTVSAVNLEENGTVSSGQTIFTLKNAENSSDFETLSQRHRDYEELMLELFVMYQNGYIPAPCDGVVSGVDGESIHLLADSGSEYTISLLANAPIGEGDAVYDNHVGQLTAVTAGQWSVMLNPQNWGDVDYTAPADVSLEPAEMTHGPMNLTPVTVFEYSEYGWQVVTEEVQAGDILLFASDSDACVWAVRLVKQGNTEPSPTPTPTPTPSPSVPPADGDVPGGEGTVPGSQGNQFMPGGQTAGAVGGFGGMAQETEQELFDLEGTDILFVTPQDTVTLLVSVDESDIGALALGMEAAVTVDVLKGERFVAEITEIAATGSNDGGSSKYAVELTMERGENMLAGQSASASIVLSTKENILLVPVAALGAEGGQALLYTGRSGDEPKEPVYVTTGLSDGEVVEITSGFAEGQTYYYSYYDTPALSLTA